ncbi:MAG TPA: hypothetical protein VF665_18625 [Longimicrobium sp.]|jgi:hypothetical protein|uniref:hypothetical protein n=1 Tax=Longimicrobium sp. TaxID=2029185 RepID=UPI002EDB73B3
MAEPELTGHEHLEHAREIIWDAVQMLEEAQRVLFRAGDRYVADVWGDGVRSVLDITETMAELAGDITAVHIELGKLAKRDRAR